MSTIYVNKSPMSIRINVGLFITGFPDRFQQEFTHFNTLFVQFRFKMNAPLNQHSQSKGVIKFHQFGIHLSYEIILFH